MQIFWFFGGAFPSFRDGFNTRQKKIFVSSENFPFLNDQLNSKWNLIPDKIKTDLK